MSEPDLQVLALLRFFCMIGIRSGLPISVFPILPYKKLTFSAAAKSSSLSTFPLLENRFSSHVLQQPQQDMAGAVAEMGISQLRDLTPPPGSIFLTGARESSHWNVGPTGSWGGTVPLGTAEMDSD